MLKTLRFYSVVTTTGAIIMALEIISSRVLAPAFGSSVYVWGSIISVFLAALSLGYYWGGRLADRKPRLAMLGRLILVAALLQSVLLFFGTRLTQFFGDLTGGSASGTLLAATVLFGPPSLFLATVSPYAVRLAAKEITSLGNTAGRLYAVSTFGSLFGTLACTFVLIPNLELRKILGLLLLATAFTAFIALLSEIRTERLFLGSAVVLVGIALFGLATQPKLATGQLFVKVTPYQTLQITEADGVRFMRGDRVLYSAVEVETGEQKLPYLRYPPGALILNPELRSMLVLGMGGGSFGAHLRAQIPEMEIDYVDIDPSVPDLASRFMLFEEGPMERVHVDDARQFLQRADRSWDYIFGDTYIGSSVPFHMTTVEFFEEVKEHLSSGGVFGLNLAAGKSDPFSKAVIYTISQSFKSTWVFGVRGSANVMVLASNDIATMTKEEMMQRGLELDQRWSFEPSLNFIASSRVDVEIDPGATVLLSDQFAPANHLIKLGQQDQEITTVEGTPDR